VRRGLSAGRVQTVALRLIAERRTGNQSVRSEEYWTIHARLQASELPIFTAKLWRHKNEESKFSNEAQATGDFGLS